METTPLDVGGEFACVEWTVEMTHTGRLRVSDELSVEPSGIRIALHGITVAEFHGDKICSLRQYWDEFAPLDQLGVERRTTTAADRRGGRRSVTSLSRPRMAA